MHFTSIFLIFHSNSVGSLHPSFFFFERGNEVGENKVVNRAFANKLKVQISQSAELLMFLIFAFADGEVVEELKNSTFPALVL